MGLLGDPFDSSEGSTWQGDVEDLLYQGETVAERVDFGAGEVVVTSHRVLLFTPEGSGSNFTQVDRPNVVGVELGHDGDADHVERALRYGIIGVVMIGAGQVVDLGGLVSDISFGSAAGRVGLGGIMGMLQTLLTLMARLDELLTTFGALALLLAVVVGTVYFFTRERVVVVSLAGDDDQLIPVGDAVTERTVERVRDALRSGASERRTQTGTDGERRPTGEGTPAASSGDPSPRGSTADGSLKSDDPLGSTDGPDGGA